MSHLTQLFNGIGGQFISSEVDMIEKLKHIKAFVFDWDGVFTNASKDASMQSLFNEADSMGTNLLRFSYYINHNHLPITSIISGENNKAATILCTREKMNSLYGKCANKLIASNHLCESHHINPNEICFIFDDVLDLSLAEISGVRIFIPRTANPLLNAYVIKNKLADYITGSQCGNFAVREACELLIGLNGNYDDVVTQRKQFSDKYQQYLNHRTEAETHFYSGEEGIINEIKA
jgi:3-deoxy-D-manno-octulosonate 8-phosphate phosphatase (KDO 8-P phosphatase)